MGNEIAGGSLYRWNGPQAADAQPQGPPPVDNQHLQRSAQPGPGCEQRPHGDPNSPQARAWNDNMRQTLNQPLAIGQDGSYTVQKFDTLSSIAIRELNMAGQPVTGNAIKAEVDRLVTLNKGEHPGLECDPGKIGIGWHLRLQDGQQGYEAPPPPPRPERQVRTAPPPERVQPQRQYDPRYQPAPPPDQRYVQAPREQAPQYYPQAAPPPDQRYVQTVPREQAPPYYPPPAPPPVAEAFAGIGLAFGALLGGFREGRYYRHERYAPPMYYGGGPGYMDGPVVPPPFFFGVPGFISPHRHQRGW